MAAWPKLKIAGERVGAVFKKSDCRRSSRMGGNACTTLLSVDAQGVRNILGEHGTVQIANHSELHTLKVIATRWGVESSFAWLEEDRKLWKNCERLLYTRL